MYKYTVIGGVAIFQYAIYIYWSVICLQRYFTFSHVYLVRVIYVQIGDYYIRLYGHRYTLHTFPSLFGGHGSFYS